MKNLFFVTCLLVSAYFHSYTQSQAVQLKDFNATDIYVLKLQHQWDGREGNKIYPTLIEKKWPITIQRDANGLIEKIIITRSGVLEEMFQPDIKSHPIYFTDNNNRIGYIQGVFLYYSKLDPVTGVSYFFSTDKDKLSALKQKDIEKIIDDYKYYLEEERKLQAGAKTEYIANKEKEAEAEKAKNSIKGKNIARIEVVWQTKEIETGLDSKIFYGIKAYDANGTVYSTSNLGGKMPWEDFTITSKGADPGLEYLMVPANCENLENDYVTIYVKSVHHSNLSTSNKIKLSYATNITINYSGNGTIPGGSDRACSGKSGMDLYVWTTTSTDGRLNLVQVKDAAGNVLHKLKVKPGAQVNIITRGNSGCEGSSSKVPGHGGNGGNVTIYKSPGMDISFIHVFNNGGRSGRGSGFARNGEDGNLIEKVQQVNLNF